MDDSTKFSALVALLDGMMTAADDEAIIVCKQLAHAAKCVLLDMVVQDF